MGMDEFVEKLENTPPWAQLPHESMMWFNRFEIYRLMGPDRSVNGAYREWTKQQPDKKVAKLPPHSWYGTSKEHDWQERAEAWDRQQLLERRKQCAENAAEAQARNQAALDLALDDALKTIAATKNKNELRLWIETLLHLTNERRKEYGYDIQRTQEVDPLEVINLQWPEEVDNAD